MAGPSSTQQNGQQNGQAAPTPLARLYSLYEQAETTASGLAEKAVASNVFAELLATTATNAMALAGVVNTVVDRGVRATRVAARADVTGLARQLARTEDKLERLLQEVEQLSAKLDAAPAAAATPGTAATVTPDEPTPVSTPVARKAAPRNGSATRASR